ncbi:MAG: ParA family protein [Clostridia bacterium]|nr:ParA family protein [Clostridia bacterium]
MAKIVSIANQKGGVGKTTTAINIAASLAKLGKKTLLVDLDPQGNASMGCKILSSNLEHTVYDVLDQDCKASEVIRATKYSNLNVLPASNSLAGAELALQNMDNSIFRLRDALNEVADSYEYVIIDCPPALGLLTTNALAASDGVIIPVQCEIFSLQGLNDLNSTIKHVMSHYNDKLSLTGIVVTMFNARLILTNAAIDSLSAKFSDKLFGTMISRSVKMSEAQAHGEPICEYDPNGKGAQEYMSVTKELIDRI